MKKILLLALICFSAIHFTIPTEISSKSKVTFEVSNLGLNTVEGSFSGMNGTINFDPSDLSSASFDVCIDAATVKTGNDKRDKSLYEEDYFDVANHPKICFQSKEVTQTTQGYQSRGTLTMKGITKEITLPFNFNNQQFKGNLTINRKDFKIGPRSTFLIGSEVSLEISCYLE